MKKILFVISFFTFLLTGLNGMAQQPWSLEKCIHYAFQNNLQIKQSELSTESSKENLLQSKLNFLPTFNASVSQNTGWGRTVDMATYRYTDNKTNQAYGSVNASLILFNGMQNVNTLRQKEFEYLAKKYNSEKIRDNIALNIAAAYLQILYSIEQVNNAKRQVQISQKQIERTKKQVEAGTVARGNLLDIEAQGANDKVNLVNAQNKLMLAYLDLMQILDIKGNTKFDIEKPNLQITQKPNLLPVQSIYSKALEIMPQIKSAEYSVKAASQALKVAKGRRSPTLSLNSSYGNNYSDQIRVSNNPLDPGFYETKPFWDQMRDNRNITLGFRLTIPILNGFQVANMIKQSKISLENANLSLEMEKNTLRKNIEQAYADALAAYQTYIARQKSLVSLRESFKYAQQKFNVGMVNSTDFDIAKVKLYNAESDMLAAKYDYIFKTKILDFYLGRSLSLKDMTVPGSVQTAGK
ncbi:TolC family protein [Candidatus Sulfidibacterium hydrothermale]|uniref:TolC family protein n=1 Tax=Candidatus Sulfidibacterium hydrothermale TaxID=2875962 RepID=UPI001F0A08FC|nr:TolC family protein [Candidatus Sulfidibacterium hydrothermale]UBM62166.1 TolC family protein [Candidatus Sulfidibacterium hydrothermale]